MALVGIYTAPESSRTADAELLKQLLSPASTLGRTRSA